MKFTKQEQYDEAVGKLMEYEKARNQWQATNNKKGGIPAEICATFPFAAEVTNELRSAIEVYEFCANAPDKYFLYINEQTNTATMAYNAAAKRIFGEFAVLNKISS